MDKEQREETLERIEELMKKHKIFLVMFARDKDDIALEGVTIGENFNDIEYRGIAQLIVEQNANKGIRLEGSNSSEEKILRKLMERLKETFKKMKEDLN